jgi:hypothetical protein
MVNQPSAGSQQLRRSDLPGYHGQDIPRFPAKPKAAFLLASLSTPAMNLNMYPIRSTTSCSGSTTWGFSRSHQLRYASGGCLASLVSSSISSLKSFHGSINQLNIHAPWSLSSPKVFTCGLLIPRVLLVSPFLDLINNSHSGLHLPIARIPPSSSPGILTLPTSYPKARHLPALL